MDKTASALLDENTAIQLRFEKELSEEQIKTVTFIINTEYRKVEGEVRKDPEAFERITCEGIKKLVERNVILIAFCKRGTKEEIIGSMQVSIDKNDSKLGYIGLFGIKSEFQSKGIGRIMMNAAEDHLKNVKHCETIELCILVPEPPNVIQQKEVLKKWYTNRGYTIIRTEEYNDEVVAKHPTVYPCRLDYYQKKL